MMVDNYVTQVFYCNDCNGNIKVKLNVSLNQGVKVRCPNCKREHPRTIKDGQIVDNYSRDGAEIICPPMSCYSKKSFIPAHSRNGIPMNSDMIERWVEQSERERL